MRHGRLAVGVLFGAAVAFASALAIAGDKIKIGTLKVNGSAPFFFAQERGYFAQEGLDAEIVFTDQPQLLPQGIMSGDLDFALPGIISAFFNISGQGAMRIIAGNITEVPTFRGMAIAVSDQAYTAGLKTFRDLHEHSYAVIAAGVPPQYALAKLAEKFGFDYSSVKVVQLGSYPNVASAIIGGSADSGGLPATFMQQAEGSGKVHNLGWLDDELRMTIAVVAISAKTADNKGDLVNRFLRAYRAGVADLREAFTARDETFREGPKAPETYAMLARYLNAPIETVKVGAPHIDVEARVDAHDIMSQIAWYKSQGMVKPDVDGSKIIDMRYALPLLEK